MNANASQAKTPPTDLAYVINHWSHLTKASKEAITALVDEDLTCSMNALNSVENGSSQTTASQPKG